MFQSSCLSWTLPPTVRSAIHSGNVSTVAVPGYAHLPDTDETLAVGDTTVTGVDDYLEQ